MSLEGTAASGYKLTGKLSGLPDTIRGYSAYEVAVINGFKGTEEEWLESLEGKDGRSAYDEAVDNGYEGTEEEFYTNLSFVGDAIAAGEAAKNYAESAARDASAADASANNAKNSETAAKAAQRAAEQARDEAQAISGGDFASTAYVDNKAAVAEENANKYTDQKIEEADVNGKIGAHNDSDSAHSDIRQAISAHADSKSNPHGVTAAQVGAYTTAETDRLLQRKVNPNLLDNCYFGNPVDQRGGYVVPPGRDYYALNDWSATVGTTDKYYPVKRWSQGDNLDGVIEIDGVEYVVAGDNLVRGYTGEWKYTIDRWKASGGVVLVTESGIHLTAAQTQFMQPIETEIANELDGRTVTVSILDSDGALHTKTYTFTTEFQGFVIDNDFYCQSGLISGQQTILFGAQSRPITMKAAGLELGTQQTRFHLENGVWVLNEIPNYAEELAKCQRYYYQFNSTAASQWIAVGQAWGTNDVNVIIPVPPMRARGTVIADVSDFQMDFGARSVETHEVVRISWGYYAPNTVSACFTVYLGENTVVNGNAYAFKFKTAQGKLAISADL